MRENSITQPISDSTRQHAGDADDFLLAMDLLDRDLLTHAHAERVLMRAWCSCPSWHTMRRIRYHRREADGIRQARLQLAEQYHFRRWKE